MLIIQLAAFVWISLGLAHLHLGLFYNILNSLKFGALFFFFFKLEQQDVSAVLQYYFAISS